MSEYLEIVTDLLDELPEVLKKITQFRVAMIEHQKSVIAANADIKGPDETVGAAVEKPSQVNPRSEKVIDLEFSPDGVYRPKRAKLEKKE